MNAPGNRRAARQNLAQTMAFKPQSELGRHLKRLNESQLRQWIDVLNARYGPDDDDVDIDRVLFKLGIKPSEPAS